MKAVSLIALAAMAVPWWDDYPITVQTSDPQVAIQIGADSCVCGVADDPCWGIHGARCRYNDINARLKPLAESGIHPLTWTETFGTCEQYIAEFQTDDDGKLLGYDADPATPRPVLNHWGWHTWQPRPGRERHWVGLPAYYEDEAWVRPWTRTHPRYGAPQFRYPDGRVASGYGDFGLTMPVHRLYDAGCSKDILGNLAVDYGLNSKVNEIDPQTGQVRGPTDGLVAHDTPDGVRFGGVLSFGKDSACPHWIEYARASARQILDFGVKGLWADNFSAWDSFGNPPLHTAFGDWSVARFRDHLSRRLTPAQLGQLGIDDTDEFDVREYLRRYMRESLGGDDGSLRDPAWRDRRWLDEPVWREFRVFKVKVGTEALQQYHDTFHEAAREAGVNDFVIQGNDIPIWSFGMPRPESLEMVSTEFSPGWNLIAGSRGVGLPPRGRISPIIKMARVHQKSRFVHIWYYLDQAAEKHRGNAALGRVLSYEMLANHAMIQPYPSQTRVAGTVESHTEVSRFIHAAKPVWADRRPLAQIGLVYSPESQLAELAPGGMVDFNAQQHAFDLIGWGTLLSERHWQYTVIPEWELSSEALKPLGVLVLPSVEVLAPETVEGVLRPWVEAGGVLILSGPAGQRYDAERSQVRAGNVAGMLPELCSLARIDGGAVRPEQARVAVGKGLVILVSAIGFDYYKAALETRDPATLPAQLAQLCGVHGIVGGQVPRELEVSVFASPARGMLFVDIANLDLDPDEDQAPREHELTLSLSPPGHALGELKATVLQPEAEPETVTVRADGGQLTVGPIRLRSYASIVIDGWTTDAADLVR